MDKKIRDLLYRSFDADLTKEEKQALADSLARSAELREEKRQIENMRKKLSGGGETSFALFFADRVMQQIYREQKPHNELERWVESLVSVFRPVAVAAVLVILLLVGYNMFTTKQISLEGALAVSNVTVTEAFDPTINLTVE